MKKSKNRGLAVLLCCLLMGALFAFAACKKPEQPVCTSHTDANEDGKCDTCGAAVELDVCDDHIDTDGDNLCEICGAVCVDPIEVSIVLKDEKGGAMAGISLTLLLDGENALDATTDASGYVKAELLPGTYTVWFEGLKEGWYVEGNMSEVEFSAEAPSHEFTAIDNNPDGSEEKPYYVGDDTVTLTVGAGATYHCFARGTSTRYLVVEGATAKVVYEGEEYLAENGVIRVLVKGAEDTNSTMPFTVTNTGTGECAISVRFESLPGTQSNPYRAEADKTLTAEVPAEGAIYYTYTATGSGYLVLTSTTPDNNIMMYNTTTYVVTSYTDGGACLYLPVNAGDTVSITVSSKGAAEVNAVEFSLHLYGDTQEEPLPVLGSTSMRIDASATLHLTWQGEEKTLSIDCSTGLTVKVNGADAEIAGGSCIFTAKPGDVITVTNTTGERTDVVLFVS